VKNYVLDSNAVLRYVLGQNGADKVDALLRQSSEGRANIFMSVVNVGEVYYILMRRSGENAAAKAVHGLRHVVSFESVELGDAIEAARIKERDRLAYADSFAAALALRVNGILVSADPDFEKLGKNLKLVRLPRHGQ